MSSEYLPEYYQPLLETPEYLRTVERIARKHTIGTSISWEDAAQTAYLEQQEGSHCTCTQVSVEMNCA